MNMMIKKALALSAVCATLIGTTAITTASAKEYLYTGTDPVCGCWNEWTYTSTAFPFTKVTSEYLNGQHYHWAYVKAGSREDTEYALKGNPAYASVNRLLNRGVIAKYNNKYCENSSNTGYASWFESN